jgi:Uma2 family endonuclease
MATVKSRPRKTIDDYMSLPEGVRAELIEGELYMSPSPTFRHQQILARIYRALDDFVRKRTIGVVCFAPLDVHLPSGDIVQPDLVFVSNAHRDAIQDWIRGTPDLIVEVVSAAGAERDRIVKRDLYARNGVPEYWIVDGEERTVEVLELSSGRYVAQGYFEASDTITSRMLEGFSVAVSQLLADPEERSRS